MPYVAVPPKRAPGYKNYGGESGRKSREFYKNADQVPEMCRTCDNNYRFGLLKAFDTKTSNIGLYDIDLVLEVNKRIVAVGEYKRYRQTYQEFLIPAFEYVAIKKVAKLMKVASFLIVEVSPPGSKSESEFYVWMIDRFETQRPIKEFNNKKWAAFSPSSGVRLDTEGLTDWMNALITQLSGAV